MAKQNHTESVLNSLGTFVMQQATAASVANATVAGGSTGVFPAGGPAAATAGPAPEGAQFKTPPHKSRAANSPGPMRAPPTPVGGCPTPVATTPVEPSIKATLPNFGQDGDGEIPYMSQISPTQPFHHTEMEDPHMPAPETSVTDGSTTASSTPMGASYTTEQIAEQTRKRNEREAAAGA
eukprot:4804844-Pyramimonas_sp.AAC.1